MRTPLLSLAAVATALVLCARAGVAQNSRSNVFNQLDAASRSIVGGGFRNDATVFNRDAVVGMLAPRGTSFLELNLVGGVNYLIAAACDEDCGDLDLRLFAADSRNALVQDAGDDDAPVINFTAPRSGRYMLAVDMAKCSGNLCYYAYRVWRK